LRFAGRAAKNVRRRLAHTAVDRVDARGTGAPDGRRSFDEGGDHDGREPAQEWWGIVERESVGRRMTSPT